MNHLSHTLCWLAVLSLWVLVGNETAAQPQQWERLLSPEGGSVRSLAVDAGGRIYATIDQHGLYRSSDDGATWLRLPAPVRNDDDYSVVHVTRGGTVMLLRYSAAPLRSIDGGATWSPMNVALEWTLAPANDSSGGVIAVGSRSLWRSTDEGATWARLGDEFSAELGGYVTTVSVGAGGEIVLGLLPSGGAVGISHDLGQTWRVELLADDQTAAPVDVAALPDGRLLAATPGSGLFRSNDTGRTWVRLHDDRHRPYAQIVPRPGGGLLVVALDTVYATNDAGTTLEPIAPPVSVLGISGLVALPDGRLLAATHGAGFYVTQGGRWRASSSGLPPAGIAALAAAGGRTLYTIAGSGRLFASTDGGDSWDQPSEQTLLSPHLAFHPTGALFAAPLWYPLQGVIRSDDGGATWISSSDSIRNEMISALAIGRDGAVYAGVDRGEESFFSSETDGVFRSTDLGRTWSTVGVGMERRTARWIVDLADGTLLLASGYEVLRLLPGDTAWTVQTNGLDDRNRVLGLVADPSGRLFVANTRGLFRSDDAGTSWERVAVGVPDSVFSAISALSDGRLLAATWESGVWASVDGGENWESLAPGSAPTGIMTLTRDSAGVLYASSPQTGTYRLNTTLAVPTGAASLERRLAVVPNPASADARIELDLDAPAHVRVTLFGADGGGAHRLFDANVGPGVATIPLALSSVAAGTYLVRVETAGEIRHQRIVVVR